jgi:hypothetical protein
LLWLRADLCLRLDLALTGSAGAVITATALAIVTTTPRAAATFFAALRFCNGGARNSRCDKGNGKRGKRAGAENRFAGHDCRPFPD